MAVRGAGWLGVRVWMQAGHGRGASGVGGGSGVAPKGFI